jgi:hypothetical protein
MNPSYRIPQQNNGINPVKLAKLARESHEIEILERCKLEERYEEMYKVFRETNQLNKIYNFDSGLIESLKDEDLFIVFEYSILLLLPFLYPKLFDWARPRLKINIDRAFGYLYLLMNHPKITNLKSIIFDNYSKTLPKNGGSSKKYIRKTKKSRK